jgi:GntR family transcriptional regulator
MQRLGRVGRRTGVARYYQLYSLLVRALNDGVIPPGGALPSESELMRLYRVSRNTVRHALERLETEKRVLRRRGSRTYALGKPQARPAWDRLGDLRFDLGRYADATRAKCIEFGWVDTPAHVLCRAPEFDVRSLRIERTRSFEGVCFGLVASYVPERVGRELTRRKLGERMVLSVLGEMGHKPDTGTQTITAVGADTATAELLGVPSGAPLLMVQLIARDAAGQPLEYQECWYRPDVYPTQQLPIQYESVGNEVRWAIAR